MECWSELLSKKTKKIMEIHGKKNTRFQKQVLGDLNICNRICDVRMCSQMFGGTLEET